MPLRRNPGLICVNALRNRGLLAARTCLIRLRPYGHNACVTTEGRRDFAHDLILPTVLFAALGAMTWSVRGCSGFGAMNGCVFAGVTWGTAWWFIARDPCGPQPRR